MTSDARHPGLILGVARFAYDPAGSVRTMWASAPGEPRLLSYLMVGMFVLLVDALVWTSAQPSIAANQMDQALLAQVVSLVFFVPLMAYLIAAVFARVIAWICRTPADWRRARAGAFWAILVSAPVQLIVTLAALGAARDVEVAKAVRALGDSFYTFSLLFCLGVVFDLRRLRQAGIAFGLLGALLHFARIATAAPFAAIGGT